MCLGRFQPHPNLVHRNDQYRSGIDNARAQPSVRQKNKGNNVAQKPIRLLLLPGDGIGTEIMVIVEQILNRFVDEGGLRVDMSHDFVGGCAYEAYGTPLADSTLEKAKDADAVLLGAVGGPQWEKLSWDLRPEAGLLRIRKSLDLFANLRPAKTFQALLGASALKPDLIRELDILILRELTAGVYFGEPRGLQTYEGVERCIDTQAYTENEVSRIAHIAFELSRLRGRRVHSADKANVMKTGVFWRDIVDRIGRESYPDIELVHMYADNCAMQLIRRPKQFDVIVTDNLFGDILSDEAAMLTGSLGMLPSASLGPLIDGKRRAMYEPVHGSAPDIAGQGLANPLAMALSLAMAFRYSFEDERRAQRIERAVELTLADGFRTADLMGAHTESDAPSVRSSDGSDGNLTLRQVSTKDMIQEVVSRLDA